MRQDRRGDKRGADEPFEAHRCEKKKVRIKLMHRRGFQFRRLRDSEGRSAESALSVRQCSEKGFTFTERAVCERQHTDTHTDSETSRLVPRIGDLKRPKNNRTAIFFFFSFNVSKNLEKSSLAKKYFSTFIFNSQGDFFVFLFFLRCHFLLS